MGLRIKNNPTGVHRLWGLHWYYYFIYAGRGYPLPAQTADKATRTTMLKNIVSTFFELFAYKT